MSLKVNLGTNLSRVPTAIAISSSANSDLSHFRTALISRIQSSQWPPKARATMNGSSQPRAPTTRKCFSRSSSRETTTSIARTGASNPSHRPTLPPHQHNPALQIGQHTYVALPALPPARRSLELIGADRSTPLCVSMYAPMLSALRALILSRRAGHGYLTILEHILEHDGCDVDPVNRLEKATPLHLALRLEDPEVRRAVVESLLEAGAETKIKDKHGETALDLVSPNDVEIRALMRKVQAQASISRDDVASGACTFAMHTFVY
ncbi:hypothetical protein A0H81_01307 [Grifola frondosa]|uniref:Uncharacterized protein n=1 Tax=Grifola frondosa TaxID=5627 RepID=A0A1C7MXH1_GRIFR|nr:hypothetical protein A0H81_01307 [Grifola frondosa]